MLKPKEGTTLAKDQANQALRKRLRRGIWVFMAIAIFLAGLMSAGVWLRRQVKPLDLYSLRFERIRCPAPPGQKHEDFLGEVRYLGELPEKLAILDENTVKRVAAAFARHPWVEEVIGVDLDPERPRVRLAFRTPVLAITQGEPDRIPIRTVDCKAFVLPADARSDGLPRCRLRRDTPIGPAGLRCADETVQSAASTAGYLHDVLARWHIVTFEVEASGLALTSSDGTRILWGHAPGLELPTEATAAKKRDWLGSYFQSHEQSRPALVDVRGPGQITAQHIPFVGARP